MQLPEFIRALDGISAGFQRSQVLFTALEGGVFPLLEERRSSEEVAQCLGWDGRGTRMLLDALVGLKLLEKEEGKYWNSEMASECLVPGAPLDQTHILRHKANGWAAWSQLPEVIRTGKPAKREPRTGETLRDFICGMQDIAKESAKGILDIVDLSIYKNMLDVAGGPGTYMLTFLAAHPQMAGTLFDLPEVIPIAQEQAEKAGMLERVRFAPGDLTQDTLGTGYDLILLSNIIHSFSEEQNAALVKKCFDALLPGGRLIIKDFLLEPGRTGSSFAMMFALQMMLHTEGGDTYTTEQVCNWTDAAGFDVGRLVPLTPKSSLWMVDKK